MAKKQPPKQAQAKVAKQKLTRQMRVTIRFGYALILLTIATLVFEAVGWFSFYTYPFFDDVSLVLPLVSFAFATLAPLLVGYLAGDSATNSSSARVHHYNGVLFGVLGVWLWMVVSLFLTVWRMYYATGTNIEGALYTMAPAIIAALGTIVLGIFYAASARRQAPLMAYKPYLITLFSSVILLVVGFGLSALTGMHYGANPFMGVLINLIVPTLFALVAISIGYYGLGRKVGAPLERLVYALTAITFGIIASMLIHQFVAPFAAWYGNIVWVVLLVWLGYVVAIRRASH